MALNTIMKPKLMPPWLIQLNAEVITCTLCPRLVTYREAIAREKRRAHKDCDYWGKPVPGFGDPQAHVIVLGLAPGAHGSNRTGRPFTGDASGKFMYPILHETGFASQPTATDRNDGLQGLSNAKVIVTLGKIAFDAYLNSLIRKEKLKNRKGLIFRHAAQYKMPDGRILLASYHPSNQNTQTGKLTREMFLQIFKEAARLADE